MTTTFNLATRSIVVALALAALMLLPTSAGAASLTRQLQIGMSGTDVSLLQAFLAEDVTLYPEGLVTGYFGPLTKAAVTKFQAKKGIDPVGRVGPITMAAINAQMAGGNDTTVPVMTNINVNPSSMGTTFSWTTNEPTRGTVYYSTTVMTEYETPNGVTISGTAMRQDTELRTAHAINVTGLQPNTTYHYVLYTTDAAGNITMTNQTTFKTAAN